MKTHLQKLLLLLCLAVLSSDFTRQTSLPEDLEIIILKLVVCSKIQPPYLKVNNLVTGFGGVDKYNGRDCSVPEEET